MGGNIAMEFSGQSFRFTHTRDVEKSFHSNEFNYDALADRRKT